MSRAPLDGEVVVDLSTGVAGAYVTKVLADAGATVIKVEDPDGDPLRRWTATGATIPDDEDGAVFQFLACSKQSVLVDPDRAEDLDLVRELLAGAHGVVWSDGSRLASLPELHPRAIAEAAPHATVLAISPFGLDGPWASKPATEATLQSWAGSPGQRGTNDSAPLLAGGRVGDWETGVVASVSYLASRHRRIANGRGAGELVDVSALEADCLTMVMYPATYFSIAGSPRIPTRVVMLPGVHPSKDGYVGFMVVTGQQWLDFCAMVERPDWAGDPDLGTMMWRLFRRDELLPTIDAWMSERTSRGDRRVRLAPAHPSGRARQRRVVARGRSPGRAGLLRDESEGGLHPARELLPVRRERHDPPGWGAAGPRRAHRCHPGRGAHAAPAPRGGGKRSWSPVRGPPGGRFHRQLGGADHRPRSRHARRRRDQGRVGGATRRPSLQHDQAHDRIRLLGVVAAPARAEHLQARHHAGHVISDGVGSSPSSCSGTPTSPPRTTARGWWRSGGSRGIGSSR